MTDQNLGLQKRRDHRGVFYIGTGVMCAVAMTLAGCSGASKKIGPFSGTSQRKLLEAEQAKLAKSERALKTAVRKLARALTVNKAKDEKLRAAQRATRKYRAEFQMADKDIADLETRLAEAKASQGKTGDGQSGFQQSGQLVESLKAKLDKSIKERDVLKAQLEKAQKDTAKPVVEVLAATSQQKKETKQQSGHSGIPTLSLKSENRVVKQNCERVLHQAEQLDKELRQSRAKREELNEKLLASLEKMQSISEQHTEEQQAAAKEVETLRGQLAKAKQQISDARAETVSADSESAVDNQCNNR